MVVLVLYFGVKGGVERVSKVAIPLLFLLFLVLIFRSVTLPGAIEGLKFYLWPDFSKLNFSVAAAALGQVFFSLSLGGTFILTYSSYLRDKTNIRTSALITGFGDGLAAVFAGLVIVPAAFAAGIELDSGPPFTFVTVPTIFENLPGGAFFAILFFALLFLAAYLSDVAAFEVLVATATDELNWSRNKALLVLGVVVTMLATISMTGLDKILWNDLIFGSTMQPIGSALVLIGLTWVVGIRKGLIELNRCGRTTGLDQIWFYWSKYVLPVGIFLILLLGLKDVFETFF